jgi:hypothetical protein
MRVCPSLAAGEQTLPERPALPSVKRFAECYMSGTRQTLSLPSVTLGKEKHTVNCPFAERPTLGIKNTRQNIFCRVPDTRQTDTLGK